jgi:nicotinate-nucleotide--dimethylbenzimidazole phosphoribosyltransferase
MNDVREILKSIEPVPTDLDADIQAHLDDLTKPPGSLGRLEEIAARYCAITRTTRPRMGLKAIYTFAGDHGVAEEGVSAFPKEVTPQMVRNMLAGGAAINVLAQHVNAQVNVVDVGVEDPLDDAPRLIKKKVRPGTANIATGPAMTRDEAERAVMIGVNLARDAVSRGVTLFGTGEMGIANTTPSSALFAALLPCPVEEITGRGTGVDDEGLQRKIRVIKQALSTNRVHLTDPLETLAALGGLEIAGICGLVLGAASSRVPVVVDGFISSAAALVACRLNEAVPGYIFFSHRSAETGHSTFLRLFGAETILDLGMRLGEGTGAALAMSVIEAAVKVYNEMATFSGAGVSEKNS